MIDIIILLISIIMIAIIFSIVLLVDNVKDTRVNSSYLDTLQSSRRIHPELKEDNYVEKTCK